MKRRTLVSLLRALVTCAVLLSGSGLTAAGSDPLYVVVLEDRAPEPDLSALGGAVLHRSANRRVVQISATAVRALAAHRGVKYIQRVQVDDAVPPMPPHGPRLAATAAVETNASPAPTWYSGQYLYDGDGNITAIGTAANQASDGGSEAYTYDSATRLVQAVIDHGTTDSEKYTYDSFGNLVDTIRTASPSTATPANPATNRLTGVTYDAVGNALTEGGSTSFVYDGLNMMRAKVKSTETATYVYTADDERIGVYENGEQRWMVRDLSNKVLREWEVTGSVWMWREDHMYRNGALAAGERELAEGGTRHFHLDHLGTPRLITDANAQKISQHDYFPFGLEKTDFRQEMVERGTSWPEPMKLTGHERDFSGGISSNNRNQLDYMHARYYSPVWGRFLAVDPVLDSKAAQKSPQMWNRYTYVHDNPVNKVDPDGRLAYHWHFLITYVAAREAGMSRRASVALARKVVLVDFRKNSQDKDARATNVHAMRGTKESGETQTIQEGRSATQASIASSMRAGDLAGALHTAQDLAAPLHADQVWKGMDIVHAAEDVKPTFTTKAMAAVNSLNVIKAYLEGNPSPTVYSGTIVDEP